MGGGPQARSEGGRGLRGRDGGLGALRSRPRVWGRRSGGWGCLRAAEGSRGAPLGPREAGGGGGRAPAPGPALSGGQRQ